MRFAVLLALLVGVAPRALAQGGAVCRGQRIDSIAVDAQAPTVTGLRRVPLLGSVVRQTHIVTRADVIRGFLLLRVGQPCSELRRAESERVLRAQPFLADATVDVMPSRRGGVILDVRTIDEASTVLGGSVAGASPLVRGLRVGSTNLAGRGITTVFGWRHEAAYDDALQIRVIDHQFARRPYVLQLASSSQPLGRDDQASLMFPFRTDLQRHAWRAVVGESRGHARFAARDTGYLALGYDREFAELGGIFRVGPPGRLTLLGLSVTNERAMPDSGPVRITGSGMRPDTGAALAGRFADSRSARVNALVGIRGLRFLRVRGIDALRGTQDVPVGLQFGTMVGRGVSAFGARSRDLFVASDLYMGTGNRSVVYRLQAQGEGRLDRATNRWDGLVGTGRLSRHARVSDARTRIVSLEWAGTARALVPHALSLDVPDGGLRGLSDATETGGRRAVARLEEQAYLGSPWEFGDMGIAAFVDAGQLWPGDIPYGNRSPVRATGGVSLLLAVPMRSTRTWRLTLAAPMNPEPGGNRWELRVSHSDLTSFFWREPADVDAARARAVPASVYSWP